MGEYSTRLISEGLWQEITAVPRAGKATLAAIAYYSQDLLKLKKGDTLVCDASEPTIRSGGTRAALLLELHRKGVKIYNQDTLHAKVACIGSFALVGSANASNNSQDNMVEAAVLSQDSGLRAQVLSLIAQLAKPENLLSTELLIELTKIPVEQRKYPNKSAKPNVSLKGTSVAWWCSTSPMSDKRYEADTTLRAKAVKKLEKRDDLEPDDLDFIRYAPRHRIAQAIKPGDRVILSHASKSGVARTAKVQPPAAVVHIERGAESVLVYVKLINDGANPMPFGKFRHVTQTFAGRGLTFKSNRILTADEYSKLAAVF